MTKAQFASYCGVAPVDCSSGMSEKHRNNHRGNRILNSILYATTIHQTRYDKICNSYYMKKLQEGKAKKVCRSGFSLTILYSVLHLDLLQQLVTSHVKQKPNLQTICLICGDTAL